MHRSTLVVLAWLATPILACSSEPAGKAELPGKSPAKSSPERGSDPAPEPQPKPPAVPTQTPPTEPESVFGPVEFTKLTDDVWLHTSYKSLPEIGPFPSNGLIVKTDAGPVLIDTAWNDAQTEQILEWSEETLGAPIEHLIVTHAHDDKMGGVAALHQRNIATHGLRLTNEAAKTRNLVPTRESFDLVEGRSIEIGGVEVFNPGAGHTEDNVVVFVESTHVLFGGCLVRPGASGSLGNVADADVEHWDVAVERLERRYGKRAKHVVPSHGPPGGPELLGHTITLVRAHRAEQAP
jgi:metallo-beta-lactamase class B